MEQSHMRLSHVVLGEQSLLIRCCELLIARGHHLVSVVSSDARIAAWCLKQGIDCVPDFEGLRELSFDYLHSITNLKMLPEWLLRHPRRMAINFHDGPLPRYAGLNAPVWAIINGESAHGVTWHQMEATADTGGILAQRRFDIQSDDTAFSLNARCYEAALDAFTELLSGIEAGRVEPQPQNLADRTYFDRSQRPTALALLDWTKSAAELQRMVLALDFGSYANPLSVAKLAVQSTAYWVKASEIVAAPAGMSPGTILSAGADSLTVACGDGALRITSVSDLDGRPVSGQELFERGSTQGAAHVDVISVRDRDDLSAWSKANARHESYWRRALLKQEVVEVPFACKSTEPAELAWQPVDTAADDGAVAQFALLMARLSGKSHLSIGYVSRDASDAPRWRDAFVSAVTLLALDVSFDAPAAQQRQAVVTRVEECEARGSFPTDIFARTPDLRGGANPLSLPLRVVRQRDLDTARCRALAHGATLTLVVTDSSVGFWYDARRLRTGDVARLVSSLAAFNADAAEHPDTPLGRLTLVDATEQRLLESFNTDIGDGDPEGLGGHCVHQLFEAQVERAPERDACIADGERITYRELNGRANRLARHLVRLGVCPGELVGVMVDRSIDMLVALYAVHKAGGAYVPLDNTYPADRIAHMIRDSAAKLVITRRALAEQAGTSTTLILDDLGAALDDLDDDNLGVEVSPHDLAYVIYTSGSTGQPKGVMIEHHNVTNFFIGMDRWLEPGPGVWLAVTSISFDISVLELFWTLARGLTVLLYTGARRQAPAARVPKPIAFGLFYWNVADEDDLQQREKYRLLLEGAKFADTHGFNAVWNPERHFGSFGGLFPNPAVTAAAVAAITTRVEIRAGSCVVPLHSPIRIAEEWAVVDNLSNGRVGISIAAGWAPPDFAIRPENYANAKQVMFESTEVVRRLWRGEKVAFPGPNGDVMVRTLPRPIQPELPIWVTTAGNIDTFIQAGKTGTHILTHLLGQTFEQVSEKIRAYRNAYREAGHQGRGTVTLMLHTFVGPDEMAVEASVRAPLKAYLKSAMNLVKAAAWQFPTFKQLSETQGKTLDDFFSTISPEDLDDLLEFAFQRYFRTSGLFGTPQQCVDTVSRTVAADVDEIACLIDFGIDTEVVLEHLPYLDELKTLVASGSGLVAPRDVTNDTAESLPALLANHRVTHLQCTPSMANMLASDESAMPGLAGLKQMMVGGEAFPPALATQLRSAVGGRVTNMYGPTETTIWSSVADVEPAVQHSVSIGRPLPNQCIYILDEYQQRLPAGLPGELVIGGAGVGRGYWQRPELTQERFLPDPWNPRAQARMYRTGDLARYRDDGSIECLGRLDHQIKIRGYRVELGEIESLLRRHQNVVEAAVVMREDQPGDQRLVGYVTALDGRAPSASDLKDWLRSSLPDFMVPATFVQLTALPLTPNGKLDRKALPAPATRSVVTADAAPPRNTQEQMIAEIWKRALGVDAVGTRDNFFDIGGHSLLVVQVLKELREQVERPIQMTDLFRHTTIEALARFLSAAGEVATPNRGKTRADVRRAALGRRRA